MQPFRILLLLGLLLQTVSLLAQNRAWDRPMQVKRCNIQVKADLFTATTFIEMEFYNPNNAEIEGLHRFRLNPGQAISHFQLELNGKYRDGSIEEKWKAANAYNTIVGKRIDPALLQMDDYNQYSLRIYPVPAKSSRKITFTITQLLSSRKGELVYELPLDIKDTVESFNAEVAVSGSANSPFVPRGLLHQQPFRSNGGSFQLLSRAAAVVLNKPLVFHIPLGGEPAICTSEESGITSFVARVRPRFDPGYRIAPKMVRVYWDVSASAGVNRDLAKEQSFLRQYLSYYDIKELEIVPFNYKEGKAVRFASTDPGWETYLHRLDYNGGTQLGVIDLSAKGADAVLVFSDGWNSYGNNTPAGEGAYVFCIYSGAGANQSGLAALAEPAGGRVINLHGSTISQAIRLAGEASNQITRIHFSSGKSLVDQTFLDGDDLILTGTLQQGGDILEVKYGNNRQAGGVLRIPLKAAGNCTGNAFERMAVWQRFDDVVRSGTWQDRLLFGKTHRVVTQSTSYLVLERVEDYVKFNIEPPADLVDECEAVNYQYVDNTKQRLQHLFQNGGQAHAQSVIHEYNRRIGLWGGQPVVMKELAMEWKPLAYGVKSTAGVEPLSNAFVGPALEKDRLAGMEEVVVVGYASMRRKVINGAVAYITSNELLGAASLEQALAGRAPGLVVTGSSGNSEPAQVRIRGIGSISSNNQPLYVLDGMPVSGDLNNLIPVSEIDNVQVLKDASATALYGSRGANGVILITSKKGKNSWPSVPRGPYKLKDMEEVEYLQEIQNAGNGAKLQMYRQLQVSHGGQPGFYLDMADHFFKSGLRNEAKMILSNASEKRPGNLPVLRAMGFVLEQYGEWKEAQLIWQQVLQLHGTDALAVLHLAQAQAALGKCTDAIRMLYEGAFQPGTGAGTDAAASSMLLTELGALSLSCSQEVDTSVVPSSLVRLMPADLRVVVEFNDHFVYDRLQVTEPGGKLIQIGRNDGKSGYILQGGNNRLQELIVKEAKAGTYKIRLHVNDYNRMGNGSPRIAKLTIIKNDGRKNESVHTETVVLDNQYGELEIGEVKWK